MSGSIVTGRLAAPLPTPQTAPQRTVHVRRRHFGLILKGLRAGQHVGSGVYRGCDQANRHVSVAASAAAPSPPSPSHSPTPQPWPQPAAAGNTAVMADAAEILKAIPRASSVQDLQDLMQQARSRGCLTTAHSVATLVQLAAVVQARASPEDAEAARQLAAQLLDHLHSSSSSLTPGLRATSQQAAVLLGLQQGEQAAPSSEAGPGPGSSSGSGAQPRLSGAAAVGQLADGAQGPKWSSDAPAPGGFGAADSSLASGKRGPGGGGGSGAAGGGEAVSEPQRVEQVDEQEEPQGSSAPATRDTEPSPATSGYTGAPLGMHDALRLGWEAHALLLQQQQQQQQQPGPSTSSRLSPSDAETLEVALQQQPPASMSLGDIAQVLQLLAELRLMPRYPWLKAARERLLGDVAAAEAEVAAAEAAGQRQVHDAAAVRLADLRLLHEASGELLQLCWEADGQQQAESTVGEEAQRQAGPQLPEADDAAAADDGRSSGAASGASASAASAPKGLADSQPSMGPSSAPGAASDAQSSSAEPLQPSTARSTQAQHQHQAQGGVAVASAQPAEDCDPLWAAALAADKEPAAEWEAEAEPRPEDPAAALARLQSELLALRAAFPSAAAGAFGAGVSGRTAADAAIAELSMLLSQGTPAHFSNPGAKRPALSAERVASLVSAARACGVRLPTQLPAAAVRLLVGVREGLAVAHITPVAAACLDASFTPSASQLEQLAVAAFTRPPAAPAPAGAEEEDAKSAAMVAAAVRTLHLAAHSLVQLGYAPNNKQFGAWVEAVASQPRALSPRQLVQVLGTCCERSFRMRPAAAQALLAAVLAPSRLQRLSAAEACTMASFAAQQGTQLGGPAGRALCAYLAPRLGKLPAEVLVRLLPELEALWPAGDRADSVASDLLKAHSAALLPAAEDLRLEQVLTLLHCYARLPYAPPPLLLLGLALAVESALRSEPVPKVLEALDLLLCRLALPPNEGLAVALREDFLLRLMVAASAPPPQAAAASAAAPGAAVGLTARQRLRALDVLAAARVRPHPAQLAALLDVQFTTDEGAMAALSGDELARLLLHCVRFRGLPSWRFMGEWLQASAETMRGGADAAAAAAGGGRKAAPPSMSAPAVARVGWCLAQMGVKPDRAWRARYHAAVLAALPELDGEAISLAAHSVLALRGKPSAAWLEGLMEAAAARVAAADLGPAAAARLLHFAAAAEIKVSKEWMQPFFLHTLRFVERPATTAAATADAPGSFSPDHIALLLRALSRLGFRPPPPWLDGALELLRLGAPGLSPACFPLTLIALARLCPDVASQLGPDSVVDALVQAAHEQRERFGAVELEWLLDSLGCNYPSYELPRGAEENLMAALRRWQSAGQWQAQGKGMGGGARGSGQEDEGVERGADVAEALGDDVSEEWLRWP